MRPKKGEPDDVDSIESTDRALAGPPVFHESQRFSHWWLWVLVLGTAGVQWWAFIEQIVLGRPFGNNPGPDAMIWALAFLVGLGLPLAFFVVRLVTEVRGGRLIVRFFPFRGRAIPLADIATSEVVTYSPLKDYGGWGLRVSRKGERLYNAYGRRGVQLTLADGRRLLVGSQRPEELRMALSMYV